MMTLVIGDHSRVVTDVTAKLIAAHMKLARAFFTRLDSSMTHEAQDYEMRFGSIFCNEL